MTLQFFWGFFLTLFLFFNLSKGTWKQCFQRRTMARCRRRQSIGWSCSVVVTAATTVSFLESTSWICCMCRKEMNRRISFVILIHFFTQPNGVLGKEVHVHFLQKKGRRPILFNPWFDPTVHFNLSSLLG